MSSDATLIAAADSMSHPFASIFAQLAPQMAELDQFLHGQLASFEPEIRPMVKQCIDTSGMRLRPALVFLSAGQVPAEILSDLVRGAAVIELVHLATLVHDDLLAEADVHRTRRALMRDLGPTPAVLLGDALFAHGLHLAAQFPTSEICAAITESTRRVCAGEIVQAQLQRSAAVTPAAYRRVADLKTAEFFRVSCFFGARLAGAAPVYLEAARRFGRHLGIAYQIYDDFVDFFTADEPREKTSGTDLARNKLGLPLFALFQSPAADRAAALPNEAAGTRRVEFDAFPAIADAAHSELAAAAAALADCSGHPAAPLLLGLCDVLQAQVTGLARRARTIPLG